VVELEVEEGGGTGLPDRPCVRTLDVPWLELVEVDVADDVEVDLLGGHLLAEVVVEQLLLRGVEAEPRRHARLAVHRDAH
jgi:hypothetical protein